MNVNSVFRILSAVNHFFYIFIHIREESFRDNLFPIRYSKYNIVAVRYTYPDFSSLRGAT